MMEVVEEATYVRHHKQKITLILSAMRHFAEELRRDGLTVDYVRLDDPANTGSFTGEVQRAIARHGPSRIVVTEPGEWRVLEMMKGWGAEIRDDDRFFATPASFAAWAEGRKQLRMEFFYRDMRRASGLLMEGDEPAGGQWNFDHDNRKSLPKDVTPPTRQRFEPDAITREVMAMVAAALRRSLRRSRALRLGGDARGCAGGARPFHHRLPAELRRLSGRDEAGQRLPLSLHHLALSQHRPAHPARDLRRARKRRGGGATRRSTRSRASSARSSAGANMCAASTG